MLTLLSQLSKEYEEGFECARLFIDKEICNSIIVKRLLMVEFCCLLDFHSWQEMAQPQMK